jgi:hypothetical protein
MRSERYPLLLLLAAMAVHGPAMSTQAVVPSSGERSAVADDVVELLRTSVQERLSSLQSSGQELQDNEVRQQLAQWYNFPNFNNQNCIRGNWKNC